MTGHLGARVTLLLDGRLSAEETERAWDHVHACYSCRDLVEREGWVKTRLAGLHPDPGPVPDRLKGQLLRSPLDAPPLGRAHDDLHLGLPPVDARHPTFPGGRRRTTGILALSGGAAGAAVLGVLALGTAPAEAPVPDRRAPLAQLVTPSAGPARASERRDP